ncbi:MAG: hypothetical protein AB1Z65_08445 [Candidatus Sulfomarinibacteraceae bacterium]
MTVRMGTTLAHDRITGELGSGGMGEIWRAVDTRLGPNHGFDVTKDGRQFLMVHYGDPKQGSGDLILMTNWK